MSRDDLSREIYERYFGVARPTLVLTFSNGLELSGKLTGFFRGEKEFNEPYIIMWRFVDEKEFNEVTFLPYPNQEIGQLILTENIRHIRFKQNQNETTAS